MQERKIYYSDGGERMHERDYGRVNRRGKVGEHSNEQR